MKFSAPWQLRFTGDTTMEMEFANEPEADALADILLRERVAVVIDGRTLRIESPWPAILEILIRNR